MQNTLPTPTFPPEGDNPDLVFANLEAMRARGPLHRVTIAGIGEVWLVCDHKMIAGLLTSKGLSRAEPGRPSGIDVAELRRRVPASSLARASEEIADVVQRRANTMVRDALSRSSVDLALEYAFPLAFMVFAELFAIPEGDHAELLDLSKAASPLYTTLGDNADRRAATGALADYFFSLIHRKSRSAGRDFLSRLIVETGSSEATLQEISRIALLLYMAGQGPTANLLSSSMLHCLRHPSFCEQFSQNPEQIARATAELARFDSPVFPGVCRYAVYDMNLAGYEVRKGDRLVFPIAGVGRDPAYVNDPDRLMFARTRAPGLPFGHGPHHCPGRSIAILGVTAGLRGFVSHQRVRVASDAIIPRWSVSPLRALLNLHLVAKTQDSH